MYLPERWVVPENQALALRPHILGLPLNYAVLMIMACMFVGLSLRLVGAAIILFFFGMVIGRLVSYFDPFAWDILPRVVRIPHLMRPN